MTRRRKFRDEVGMNLFPFLAVLICTMGSIIMLLVVMVQQARVRAQESATYDEVAIRSARVAADQAIAKHEQRRLEIENAITERNRQVAEYEKAKQAAEDAQIDLENLNWKIDTLKPAYDKTLEDLAQQRLALSHLEQHTRELSEQASQMQAEAELIAKTAKDGAQNIEEDESKLDGLKSKLAAARAQLDAEREKTANRTKQYALVAYDGPSGTQRPPIYIECMPDRVILQPENVVLIGEDFRAPLNQQNPLASALRAKREFMMENGMLPTGNEPYPLLVVRPGSASSYAAARAAMTAWESEFGYELVESEIKLDYQVADPRLATLLQDVVTDTRGRRKMMFSMMDRQRPRQRELLRPSRSGGFEVVPDGSSSFAGGSGDAPSENRGNAFARAVAGQAGPGSDTSNGMTPRSSTGVAERQSVERPIGTRQDEFPAPPGGFVQRASIRATLAQIVMLEQAKPARDATASSLLRATTRLARRTPKAPLAINCGSATKKDRLVVVVQTPRKVGEMRMVLVGLASKPALRREQLRQRMLPISRLLEVSHNHVVAVGRLLETERTLLV